MSKSDAFLKFVSDETCLNCNHVINQHKSFTYAPPDKFTHLICNPDNSSIQFCRKILGWGQRDLANAFGVSVTAIQEWENGRVQSIQMRLCQKFLANMLDKRGVEATALRLNAMCALSSEERNKELVAG